MDTQPIGCLLVEDSNQRRMKTVPSQGGEVSYIYRVRLFL